MAHHVWVCCGRNGIQSCLPSDDAHHGWRDRTASGHWIDRFDDGGGIDPDSIADRGEPGVISSGD